jgi:hypothetical protein
MTPPPSPEDEIDGILDAHESDVEARRRASADAARERKEWALQFERWVMSEGIAAFEPFAARFNERGWQSDIEARKPSWTGGESEPVLDVIFSVTSPERIPMNIVVRRSHLVDAVDIERSGPGGATMHSSVTLAALDAEAIRQLVIQATRDRYGAPFSAGGTG